MKDKGSSAISFPGQESSWLEIFHGERDNVASSKGTVVLEDLGMDLETVKTSSSIQMQRLVSDDMVAYDINIPVDNERRNMLRCSLTVIRGRADLYHGYGVEFLQKPFIESLHGKHVDKFCMNVVFFSFLLGSVSSVMNMIDIILSNNIDMMKAMRWLNFPEKASVDSKGHNFLHYVALSHPDTRLVVFVRVIMSLSLPESHADNSKEVNKKYVKWMDTVTDKGETPLSLSILYAHESAFHEFMDAEPSLCRLLENGILAERYTNVNYAHLSHFKQFRDEREIKESAAKIQLTLKNKIVEMQQKKAAILKELLEVPIVPCAPSSKSKNRRSKKKMDKVKNVTQEQRPQPCNSISDAALVEDRVSSKEVRTFCSTSAAAATALLEEVGESKKECATRSNASSALINPCTTLPFRESDERVCVLCMDETPSVAIIPCGHMCMCTECAKNARVKTCPLCRATAKGTLKVYGASI
ncbi:hypothetical protein CYMTET_41245 [Cymbomonas tetramitiformis]|uniref:RING-type domain-containing protein n=1 Tax=Cymbomonas tetramitiformis TaxID=36881 RepID=A0AAE0C8G9_9CHLO|nr:hypothetical protein CYMTET_41245 [Cymbomonas tetramitiformis]